MFFKYTDLSSLYIGDARVGLLAISQTQQHANSFVIVRKRYFSHFHQANYAPSCFDLFHRCSKLAPFLQFG